MKTLIPIDVYLVAILLMSAITTDKLLEQRDMKIGIERQALSSKTNTVTLTNYVTVTNVVHGWRGSEIIVTNAPLWPANATGVWMRATSTNWKCPHHNNPWHEVTENCPDYEK